MHKKKLILAATLVAILSAAVCATAAITLNQVIHIQGTATYPVGPTPTPTPEPDTVAFSLWYSDGTECPGTITGITDIPVSVESQLPVPYPSKEISVYVRNDGNVPITAIASIIDVSLPSNVRAGVYQYFANDSANNLTPLAPGDYAKLNMNIYMVVEGTDYPAHGGFDYTFGLLVTATQK